MKTIFSSLVKCIYIYMSLCFYRLRNRRDFVQNQFLFLALFLIDKREIFNVYAFIVAGYEALNDAYWLPFEVKCAYDAIEFHFYL